MEHAGVSFPEEYVPHGVKLLYNGEPIDLTPDQEEAVTFFASMDPDGMHLGNPKTAPIFIKNFWSDFRTILTNTTTTKTTGGGGGGDGDGVAQISNKKKLKDFAKCDFEPIRRYLNEQKIIKKAITDEQKKANKYVFFVLLLYEYIYIYIYIYTYCVYILLDEKNPCVTAAAGYWWWFSYDWGNNQSQQVTQYYYSTNSFGRTPRMRPSHDICFFFHALVLFPFFFFGMFFFVCVCGFVLCVWVCCCCCCCFVTSLVFFCYVLYLLLLLI